VESLEIDYPVETVQQIVIVGHGDQGGSLVRCVVQENLHHPALVGRIQIPGGLIGQDQLGIDQERPADRNPLLLAVGKKVGGPVQLVLDIDLSGQLDRSLPDSPIQIEGRVDPIREQDVVEHGQVFQELELLENQSDVTDPKCATGRIVEVRDLLAPGDDTAGPG
jgi:hypothetical protein